MQEMIYMLDAIILVRMMTAMDLEFEKAMHYHDKGYESSNDYGYHPELWGLSVFT